MCRSRAKKVFELLVEFDSLVHSEKNTLHKTTHTCLEYNKRNDVENQAQVITQSPRITRDILAGSS